MARTLDATSGTVLASEIKLRELFGENLDPVVDESVLGAG